MTARFSKLEQLRRSSLAGGRGDWLLEQGPIKGSVRLVYYPRGRENYRQALKKVAALRGKPMDARMREFFARRQRELRDLDVTLQINLPGTVLMTHGNVKETGLRQVTARVQGRDIRNVPDLLLAMAPRFEVVFDGRACTFKVDKPSKLDRAPLRPRAATRPSLKTSAKPGPK